MLIAYAAEEMPLFLKEDDLFAGWHGFEKAHARPEEHPFIIVRKGTTACTLPK